MDIWTVLVVPFLGAGALMIVLFPRMDYIDWYAFWTGGPVRRVMYEILKKVIV